MSKVINIIGVGSNVGKTILMEGLIKEIKARGFSVGTIKHDVNNFDIDKKGKDTYRHREAGSETVIISSKNRLAVIKEIKEEATLDKLIEIAKDKDFILIEGYKNSNLRKIEVFREDITAEIITPKEKLIAIASNVKLSYFDIPVIKKDNFKELVDLIEKEEEY
ncbi:molybdopterin-guanine dinucleotide biosynthesis protein B [Clostridium chauvoei]|uniref:molybdopterin-guanine dinucleotide biosynthesis protein B n=1 Tax=Clostridium chauvoei TaxID=46867 RepID=UPI001C85C437|nr:molybdopterin-guanine dinucleotide biosynthesis protein B [Clostridium chauvoei]MBX7321711.1 molybdopterin-guanine dinucleotide biosynthesis protein B [Clostridium chauvoei]